MLPTSVIRSNSIKYIVFIFISFAATFFVHKNAFDSHLRHGMVEDGSVSQYAGDLLDNRSIYEKYLALLECDGLANGRYRPAYFIFETIPFIFTVIKNGDYQIGLSTNSIKNRLNGDVRIHMLFLLATISFSLLFGSIIVYKLSDSFLYSSLFPLTVLFSPTLVRNITYNDTAEVPQLIGFSLFTALFFLAEKSAEKNKWKHLLILMILVLPVASLLYLTKETTVVLMPAILLYIVISYYSYNTRANSDAPLLVYYGAIQFIFNCILAAWVLLQVKSLKGGYSNYYEMNSMGQMWKTFISYKNILVSFPPTVYLPLFALMFVVIIILFPNRFYVRVDQQEKLKISFIKSLLLFSIAIGLLLLNLPWKFVEERYMLPVAFFLAIAGCVLLGSIEVNIFKRNWKMRLSLLVAFVAFSYPAAAKEIDRIYRSYDEEFGHHKVISALTQNIISDAKVKNSSYRVMLDVGKMSSSMWIQAARIINFEGNLNVNVPGQKFPPERLYLREFESSLDVIIVPSDGDGDVDNFDVIYSALPINWHGDPNKEKRIELIQKKYLVRNIYPIIINGKKTHEMLEFMRIDTP